MKKSLIVIILIVSILFIYGCGKKEEDNVSNTTNNNIDNTNTVTNEKEYNFYDKSRLTGQTYASYKEAFNNFSFDLVDSNISSDPDILTLSIKNDGKIFPYSLNNKGTGAKFEYDGMLVFVERLYIKKESLKETANQEINKIHNDLLNSTVVKNKNTFKSKIVEENDNAILFKTFSQERFESNGAVLSDYRMFYYKVISDDAILSFSISLSPRYDENYEQLSKRFDKICQDILKEIPNSIYLDDGSPYLFDKLIYTKNSLNKHIRNSSDIKSIIIKDANIFITYEHELIEPEFNINHANLEIQLWEKEGITPGNYSRESNYSENKVISTNPNIILSDYDSNLVKVTNGNRTEYYKFSESQYNKPKLLKDGIKAIDDFNNNLSIFFE